jgi:prefoldin subunit 5
MASITEIVGELENTKNELEEAKTAAEGAEHQTDEMITQSEGMDLEDKAESLRMLKTQIEAMSQQILTLTGELDEIISNAEAIRNSGTPG